MFDLNNFRHFEQQYYDFYRFSSLVKDLLIYPNNLSIPYDIEMQIIHESFITVPPLEDDSDLTPYEQAVEFIQSNAVLLSKLKEANENP